MKLRSLIVATLLVPGFTACDKKKDPAPAAAPAAPAAAAAASPSDTAKRALEHHKKLNEAIANAKGDVEATKKALASFNAAEVAALNEALAKLGGDEAALAKLKTELAAEIAAAKTAQDAAAAYGAALATNEELGKLAGPLVLATISNLVAESEAVAAAAELAGGAEKAVEEAGEKAVEAAEEAGEKAEEAAEEAGEKAVEAAEEAGEKAEEAGEAAAEAAGEGFEHVKAEFEAFIAAIEEHAENPEAAAAALKAHVDEMDEEAVAAFQKQIEALRSDKAALGAWATGAGKDVLEKFKALIEKHPALLTNEALKGALERLNLEADGE